ncbi:type 2 isopentenyl-diphosphate Delta-isomerase [Thermophagus xiamenensis]|nr:type 2 isopentenyl-diphosphate Delta-isomerase [Thermophagus xiamenensis]
MSDRKKDHIDMALSARTGKHEADNRFHYEPLLASHHDGRFDAFSFAGKTMTLPIWVSSMTGGTRMSGTINRNLAQACGEFGMGMGLGSCRALLDNQEHWDDFNIREYMGESVPFYANLGIAQIEKIIDQKQEQKVVDMVDRLKADGLIIHVNPLQEAFQPEGDTISVPPIETIEAFLERTNLRIIVKEVGQGMGPESLRRLLSLPLEAIEFGALGGTNFTKLEISRIKDHHPEHFGLFDPFGKIGHTAPEMTHFVNIIAAKYPVKCQQLIISGGINNVVDGFYLTQISSLKSVFGMASAFLKHAMDDYETLKNFVIQIKKALGIARQYLIPVSNCQNQNDL